jgi:ABC-type Mn2+/Zn2+ transport system permease subunit
MIQTKTLKRPSVLSYFLIALIIAACCFCLGYIDHETKQFSDLLTPQNIAALTLYFLPTFIVCAVLLNWFSRKRKISDSMILALLAGIPLTFALMILVLLTVRG